MEYIERARVTPQLGARSMAGQVDGNTDAQKEARSLRNRTRDDTLPEAQQ